MNLTLEVQGEPAARREPGADPRQGRAGARRRSDSGGDGPSLVAVIGLGLVGVLVGLALGALFGRRCGRQARDRQP